MTRNFKTLGLGLIAALAMSTLVGVGASANITAHTGGHFTQASGGVATLHGDDKEAHETYLTLYGKTINCTSTYTGTVSAATVTSFSITPHFTECNFEGAVPTVFMNGCVYTFTVRNTHASTLHSPIRLKCPEGKKIELLQHGACTITFGEQEITNAVIYTTTVINGKYAITADITLTTTYEKHGVCELKQPYGRGPHTGASLTGSTILTGRDFAGSPVSIAATGINGL